MWEFYLAGSEAAFRYQGLVVFQVQLGGASTPCRITRDYMYTDEHRLLERDRIAADAESPPAWPASELQCSATHAIVASRQANSCAYVHNGDEPCLTRHRLAQRRNRLSLRA